MEIGQIPPQSFGVGRLPGAERTDATGFAAKLESAQAVPTVTSDVIPSSPPAEVLAEVERAAARAEELRNANRELHFEKDPASNRIIVQVKDLDGNVLRTIPPSSALGVMAGGGL